MAVQHRAYKFRLYPNSNQERELLQQLETLRRVYNDALHLSQDVYHSTGKSPKRGYLYRIVTLSRNSQLDDQRQGLSGPKWLTRVSAVAVRDVCARVETAFDNFFRRLRQKAARAGFPRFKGYGRLNSIPFNNTYPAGCVLRTQDGKVAGTVTKTKKEGSATTTAVTNIPESRRGYRLDVFGVGQIRVIVHRGVEGQIKTATVTREPDGKWYVVLMAEQHVELPQLKQGLEVGIDVGLKRFVTCNDGSFCPNPEFLGQSLKRLRRIQRSASRKFEQAKRDKVKIRTRKNLQKKYREVAKAHVKVRNQRRDFHYQVVAELIKISGSIAAEGLNVQGMSKNRRLARRIADVGWSDFLLKLERKAVSAGVRFIKVNPAYTSQTCSKCGYCDAANRPTQEKFHCLKCGRHGNADHNAACNIRNRGRQTNTAGQVVAARVKDSNPVVMPPERSGGGRGGQRKTQGNITAVAAAGANLSRNPDQTLGILGVG